MRTPLVKGIEGGAQGLSGYIEPEEVADKVLAAIEENRFLITTHPNTDEYVATKATERDRWVGGMRKLRRMLIEQMGRPM